MGPVTHKASGSIVVRTTTLLLILAAALPCGSQRTPPPAHPPSQAILALPRVQVPDVRGRRAEEAETTLKNAGLIPGTTSRSSGPGIVGTVSQQDPAPNATVVRGTKFNLVLVAPSAGSVTNDGDQEFSKQVPRLTGLTPNQASALLERDRLMLGSVVQGIGKGANGTIYSQDPQPGSFVTIGNKVNVNIVQSTAGSNDVIWVFVPNVVGQQQKAAEASLRDHHLRAGRVSSGFSSVPTGSVFQQSPLPNTRVQQDSTVDLVIAQTPPPSSITVPVPDILHQDLQTATSRLEQSGLRLGQVTSEESDDTDNSVLAQSPVANTPVQRGSSVDVKIAKPIPTVSVPNIVQREEKDAVTILQNAGLRLGAVDESASDQSTGTVLSQNPNAGELVRENSAVSVTLSRQNIEQLSVLVKPANPAKGQAVQFHAHLEPPGKGVRYRFVFGDQTDSGWLASSNTAHIYKNGGAFQVQAIAARGTTTFTSESVTLFIPSGFPWGLAGTIGTGIIVLGGAGALVLRARHARLQLRESIQVAPRIDAGVQRVSIEQATAPNHCVRIRAIQDAGNQSVQVEE